MNKIFRIVWSQATQSWVVVSELTKAHKKQSSSTAKKSAFGSSANLIKSSAIALALLSGHSAYAAINVAGTGHDNAVAFGPSSNASQDGAVALGKQAIATGTEGAALGKGAKAQGNLSVAVGVNAQASANNAMALGLESKATQESAVALGFKSKATSFNTVALGTKTDAAGQRSMAFGNEAKATANDTIAIGASSVANKLNDIIIGKEAKSRDEGGGHSVAVGYNATAGSSKTGAATDVTSTGKNTAAGGVAIGVSSYTGLNRNNAAINSSVAIGAGAGAGFRAINADGIPTGNGTDPDDNATVLSKAFGNTPTEAGNKDEANRFNYKGVDINEGTAVGRNTRAIGDQAVALGAQSIAGQGAIAIGGNDITQFANARYFMSNKDNFGVADVSDHDQSGTLASKNISQKYQELVGAALNTAYQATYAQNGSTVIGMQAHSTTPLGVAIGTNALVRKGAYGATAIGSGSAIQANAEAAVAIGMGSWVNGKFGVAAGTASRAEQSAVAAGYKANADKSAVAVGDSSKATNSSVAVGQLAQATKEADIAVGQGAKASGNQGAIAMGLGTNAQGDSSIMIGGANIDSASKQNTTYEKGNGKISTKTVTEIINGHPVQREYSFAGTTTTNGTVAQAYKELTGRDMNIEALNFADNKYKNGHASTSLGVHALSKGDLGTAIGAGSRSDAIGSVALGTGAHATRQNAVAIGTGSTTELVGTRQLSVSYNNKGEIVDDNSKDVAYTFNWAGGTNTAEGDVVSFGSSGAERQLKNVAAGRVAEDSTDAINGSQLNSISKKVALGWNIAGDPKTRVAGIGADDQVNFVNGNGTTVTVEKQDEVKSGDKVTTPKGANVKFDVKAKDGSITSNADGITVNTDGTTITKDVDGKLKVNTGNITNSNGVPTVADADKNKIATAETVANAIKDSYWIASATKGTSSIGNDDNIKAGTKVIFDAGKNIEIEHSTANKFTFKTVDTPEFKNITLNDGTANPNKVSLTPTADGLKLSKGDNADSPVKITNVAAGTDEKDAVNYKQLQDALNSVSSSWKIEGSANGGTYNKDASTATAEQIVSKDDKVGLKAGKNIVLDQSGKEFTYSLSKELTELEKVEVKDDKGNTVVTTPTGTTVTDKDGNTSKLDGTGLTITPNGNTDPNKNVSVTKDGINAGGNTISNVAGNLPGAKTGTDSPTTNAAAPNNVDTIKNNAATVGDVLNAGWNLQNNGTAKDFVKPYDTVNFVNGANTTAVVTTSADGTTSNVTYNVTGLPVTYTDAEGNPVAKIGDKYYKVNDKGQPLDANGQPSTKVNDKGQPVDENGNEIAPVDTTKPLKTALVNPTPAGDKTNTTDPTALNNVTSGLNKYGDTVDGAQVPGSTPANNGLVDLSKPADGSEPKVSDNTAATVGDLRNMGWIVSSDKTTGSLDTPYTATVKNANEVKFVGEGTATVSGKTDEKGVRTITVKVDDQVSTNNAVTPVVYTDKEGNTVYPIKDDKGNVTYHTTPDGKGENDKVVPNGDVNTSINGPKDEQGNTRPASLSNVKNNIPAVNDTDKKVTNPDGKDKPNAGDVANINKAPLTATEAADLLNPTKDGKSNPNFVGNNAATVSDVLNAGWNLQNNGEARDFVKPFDTVNFVNGGNTTAVVTTAADGTTSDVTFNVTGLPITYTTADGKPVSKVGDKYYPVNKKGQPIGPDGKPAVKTAPNGDLLDEAGNVIQPIDTAKDPLKSNLVNPNVANSDAAPNNQTTSPTQLGNVANGANTFDPVDSKKMANDGKWYPADQVEPNGQPKTGAAPVEVPANIGKAGLIDFSNSNPNNAATVGDLQNLGWIVSAKGNNYSDQVRNANKVEFKGTNGVEVTGKTLEDGTREITVGLKEGKVTNDVIVTKADGTETHAVRGEDGKIYTKDPVTGKATTTEIQLDKGDTVTNDGNALVTGNKVATAIQKSGWNVGIGSTDKDFSTEAKTFEKVNPNDNVKYVNGANTTVSMAVDAAEDKDGTAVTTTYVKVDVNRDLNIDSVTTGGPAKDKAGNPLKQVNGEYYPENALVNDGKVYPAGTVIIDGKPYPAGSAKDPKTNEIVKDGKPAPEVQPLSATPKDQLADGKDGAMTVKDAKGNDGVSATAKDGKGTLTLKDAGKDGKDASQVDISTAKAPADLENTPKDAVRANDGNWYTPADVTVEVKDGKTVVTPKAGKTPIPNAPTMDRIQYTGTDGKPRNVATMDDGLRFVGDDGETISKPLNSTMEFTGGNRENGKPVAKEDTTTGNIGVFHDNGKLSVQLAKDLEKMNSANFETPDGTSTKITGNGLSVTPETAKLKDPKTGKPILDKDGNPKVDPKKVVSFGGPTIMKDPKTGKPVVDSKTGEPVMESGISAGGQVMTNVAPGRISPTSTDAVNGSQLHAVASSIGNLNNKINKVGKHADAGTASALAASNIPQAYTPGKSLVGIAAGSYQGQTGVAVGMSRISDNGKIIIRLSGTTNTQGRAGVAAGVGYQW